ncbi:unnamed protein product [marine sediment metagenome]|uniref:Uncharacterized protein n=1 Tax=marine sediment metagenome TaxID=412755 RepID=X1QQ41_9ZZZZ
MVPCVEGHHAPARPRAVPRRDNKQVREAHQPPPQPYAGAQSGPPDQPTRGSGAPQARIRKK